MVTSKDLFDQLEEGNSSLLYEVYKKYKPLVLNWILSHNGTKQEGEDIFQDSLETILINYREREIELKPLILKVSKNKWIDQLRKLKSKAKYESEVKGISFKESAHEEIFMEIEEDRIKSEILDNCFNKLSKLCQDLLMLSKENVSVQEQVKQLAFSNANSFYKRKFSCMKRWKAMVQKHPKYNLVHGS